MIDEQLQDTASLYVLGLLEPHEACRFEAELQANAELQRFVSELHESVAALAHDLPAKTPPAELKSRVLESIRAERKVVGGSFFATRLPWALAACLAVVCALLFEERTRLQKDLAELQNQDVMCQMKIATMSALIDSYSKGVAVVVWDGEKQTGMLKVQNMPVPKADQDYQLWVVDPAYKQPVNAGVFGVGADGVAKATFKPSQPVTSADKFAISLEHKGGAVQHKGPIIMISQ